MTTKLTLRLLAAPFIGAAFVMFLPFIGFVLVGQALWQKVRYRGSTGTARHS